MLIFLRHPGQILDRTLGQILDQNNFRTCTGLAAGGEKMRRVVSRYVTTAKVLGEQALIILNVLIIIPYLILITITEPLSFQQSQNDFFLMIRGTLRSNQTTHWRHAHGELPGCSLCFYSHIHDQQNICIISQVFLKEHDLKEHNDD